MESRLKIIACIPAYNEERTIASVVVKTMRYVNEVIVCDDGSGDLTGEIARRLGAKVVRHERNMGKGIALMDLFTEAKKFNPDVIITLDADGQHNPDDIPRLIKPIVEGAADIVIGSRFVKGGEIDAPLYRRFGLTFINFLSRKLVKSDVRDTQTGFRAFTLKALNELESMESRGYGVETEQLMLAKKRGLRIIEVPVMIRYKGLEKTSKKFPFLQAQDIVTTILRLFIEEHPLRYLGIPGVALIILTVISGTYLLLMFNATRYFSIPIALITLAALFTGIMLLITAIILYAMTRLTKKMQL